MNRYLDWLHQAENDLKWAEHSLAGEFFSQTCFIAQQAGKKALKAYCFFKCAIRFIWTVNPELAGHFFE